MTHTALLVRTASTIAVSQHFLEGKGLEVIPAPVTKTRGIFPEPCQLRNLLGDNDLLCCLSQNAVHQLRYYQGQLPVNTRVWTVGAATKNAMQGLFKAVSSPAVETSEGLFDAISSDVMPGTRVALLKGIGGREFLVRTLAEAGAIITQINLYQREVDQKAIQKVSDILAFKQPSVMMVGSGELLQVINRVLSNDMRQRPVIVPGARVALLAKKLGFNSVIDAQGASANAFYDALAQL